MPKIKPNSTSEAIGARIKMHRRRRNISQKVLGKHLGVSYQQIQKYENGTNHLSTATLMKIAAFLRMPPGDLIQVDERKQITSGKDIARFAKSREGKALVQGFLAISSPSLRRHIVGLMEALSR